jgi:hypothetical protein
MIPQPSAPAATPTRGNARVQVQATTQINTGNKAPIYGSTVLNLSMGGALIFSHARLQENALLGVELGPPVFPISRLVRARVAHIKEAPEEVMTILRQKGKADKKKRGYLIGVEFTYVEPDDRQTMERFIKQQLREEKQRRIDEGGGEETKHTARERVVQLNPAAVPNWAWALGFFVGLYEFVSGWLAGAGSWGIALHVGAALLLFWFVGRIAAAVWNQLEAWRTPDATIVAHIDGTETNLDEVLADADSELEVPEVTEPDKPALKGEVPQAEAA